MGGQHVALRRHPPAGEHRRMQRRGARLPAMVLRTDAQPARRHPSGQPYPATHPEEARLPILRHHLSGQRRREAGFSEDLNKTSTQQTFRPFIALMFRYLTANRKSNTLPR